MPSVFPSAPRPLGAIVKERKAKHENKDKKRIEKGREGKSPLCSIIALAREACRRLLRILIYLRNDTLLLCLFIYLS
jgi:hypothetical protein